MEKILLAIDAKQIDKNTVDFGCYIANLTHSKLTGIFLENLNDIVTPSGVLLYGDSFPGMVVAESGVKLEETENQCKINIRLFKDACAKRNVSCNVHRDRGVPVKEIIHESRFADLLILDAYTSFEMQNEAAPSEFSKKVLSDAECPAIVAPKNFGSIEEIVFTYDGSDSSVFAIKQFAYLFPQLDDKSIILLQVNGAHNNEVMEKRKIAEWLKSHYSNISLMVLNGKTKNELSGYLADKKDSIVVMGAFGRSSFSQLFRSSSAETILKTAILPVFIAHL